MQRYKGSTVDGQNDIEEQQQEENQPEYKMDRLQEILQHDTTLMVDRMPTTIGCRREQQQIPQNAISNRKTTLAMCEKKVSRGQHQESSLSRGLTIPNYVCSRHGSHDNSSPYICKENEQ